MWRDLLFIILQIMAWFAWFLGIAGVVIFLGWIALNLIGAKLLRDDAKEQNARTAGS